MGLEVAVSATQDVLCAAWLERLTMCDAEVLRNITYLSDDNSRGRQHEIGAEAAADVAGDII